MQKKISISLLTIILIITLTLTLTLHVSLVNASPVIFNMNTLPENQGWTITKYGNATSSISNGILSIENNYGNLSYFAPADWKNTANSTSDWIVEFRLKIGQSNTLQGDYHYILIDITYPNYAIEIGLNDDGIFVYGLTAFDYLMNTTDTFHVYRIVGQSQGQVQSVRVFVDEKIVGESRVGRTTTAASLAIVSGGLYTKSYWDYFSYDTNPTLTLTSPTLNVIDGTSSYYVSNLSNVVLDNSVTVIPNGTYAGWCVDRGVKMIRNETHKVMLYSSTQYIAIYQLRQPLFNWKAVNYILNHKPGSMQQIQNASWYFVPDFWNPPLNETNVWNMINGAKANPNYIPSKGEIMAVIAFSGYDIGVSPSSNSGVQNTIIEYRIP